MELGFTKNIGDFSDIRGYEREKRVMEVAASGMHPLVFCGSPDDNIHIQSREMLGNTRVQISWYRDKI